MSSYAHQIRLPDSEVKAGKIKAKTEEAAGNQKNMAQQGAMS